MLDKSLENSLDLAFRLAFDKAHEFMTVEHLLLALLENNEVKWLLVGCGVDMVSLHIEISNFLDTMPVVAEIRDQTLEITPTIAFERVLERAIFHVQTSGNNEVSPSSVLVAIFSEKESQAVYLLNKSNLTRFDAINYISHGVKQTHEMTPNHFFDQEHPEDDQSESSSSELNFLINLNEKVTAGEIDPLIGRNKEVERCVQILCRRRKNNPLLVGEAGVGKTAIAEGLVYRIVNEDVPDVIADNIIYSLDIGALLAGTKYRGEFEERFKNVLELLGNQENSILFIDDIHTIIGAGASTGGQLDAANLLKPLLSGGKLRCMGSTTYKEFGQVFEKEHALARRFQKIDVLEPSVKETIQILQGLRSRYEKHHDIHYTNKALEAAVELSAKYINDRHLPDKAIDVIDEAGAQMRLQPENRRKKTINVLDIETVIASIARIPQKSVTRTDKDQLAKLSDRLKMKVFGQDSAINELTDVIHLNRSGLSEDQKPIGSFLFAGPTGVGKTEVTAQLAKALGVELLRFDMSEYMERHTVSRLIGAPPGYVGFDDGGLLTDAVNKTPHAVLLLDEIEKAHPDVFNLLLQVMDNGSLTDSTGRKVDFRNIILVMTSNAGAENISRSSVGFTKQDHSLDTMKAIEKTFTPEFRNRLDGVIQFKPLDETVIISIVDKFLIRLESQLNEKNVTLIVDDKAKRWLAKTGYDPIMGARPMERLIQEKLKKEMADELLFGKLSKNGGIVRVTEKADALSLSFEEQKNKEKVVNVKA